MVRVCEQYGEQFGMAFNSNKSVCTLFSRKRCVAEPRITLSGFNLSWVKHVKHLGNYMSNNMTEDYEIRMKRNDFIRKTNTVIANYGCTPEDVLLKMFKTQCCDFYGSQAWNFNDHNVHSFHRLFNRSVRRLLHLPYTTHTRYLPAFMAMPLSIDCVLKRFVKLYDRMINSDNAIVSFITRVNSSNKMSIIGGNIDIIEKHRLADKTLSLQDECIVQAIKDVRNGLISIFNKSDCDDLLNRLCTE